MNNSKKRVFAMIFGALVVTGCGLTAGAAFAGGSQFLAPWGIKSDNGQNSDQMPAPTYSKNSSGLSYGSAAEAPSAEEEPDLIRVLATNGKEGYVFKTDLDDANGVTAMKSFKSPADAIKWQQLHQNEAISVKVYDVTGFIVIGEFKIASTQTSTLKEH